MVLLTSGALSDLILSAPVVQQWLLAIDRDRTAIGLLFESPPICIIYHQITTILLSLLSTKKYSNTTCTVVFV